jgi:sugar lactone lactonase YvrE/pimeloyl-ACP methyl ester carboxylesterase
MRTVSIKAIACVAFLHLAVAGADAAVADDTRADRPAPVVSIAYGSEPQQFGELRVPRGRGPHPLAVVIHGGCWMSGVDLHLMDALCNRLTESGIATWNLEYRRIGDPGGGWPGTFLDVGRGVDYVSAIAADHGLDLESVVIVGHSSGGHLTLWAAARHVIPADSPLHSDNPFIPAGAVSLAGPPDIRGLDELAVQVCGENVLIPLLGGTLADVPQRYDNATPMMLMPSGVPRILIHGALDGAVSPEMGLAYVDEAKSKDELIGFTIIPDAGHMDVIDPTTPGWPVVEASIRSLLIRADDGDPETTSSSESGPHAFEVETVASFTPGVHGMAFSSDGTLYYSDTYKNEGFTSRVYTLRPPYNGKSEATAITGATISGLLFHDDALYVCATGENGVRRYGPDLKLVEAWRVSSPWCVVPVGDSLFVVTYDGRIYELAEKGGTKLVLKGLEFPFDLADAGGGTFYASEQVGVEADGRVRRFDPEGQEIGRLDYGFANPEGLAVDDRGCLYIADTGAGKLLRASPDGHVELITDQYEIPIVVALGPDGNIYFNTAGSNSRLVRVRLF